MTVADFATVSSKIPLGEPSKPSFTPIESSNHHRDYRHGKLT